MTSTHLWGLCYYLFKNISPPPFRDILNIMSFDWPERFFLLDARWNWQWRPDHDFKAWGMSSRIGQDIGMGG